MYNFKEFFTKNFDYTILLEARANRGTYIKNPTLLDEEDLDYLYQIDQSYWKEALQQRIQKTWNLLKDRQNIRNRIAKEMLSEIKSKFSLSKTAAGGVRSKRRVISITSSNIRDIKNLILSISGKYDNYGRESSSSEENREELSAWLDKVMDNYDLTNTSTRGYEDNFRTIRDLIHEVIKHIVIYVKGGDQEEYYVGNKRIKFYINRYIEKLETLPGDEHTIKTKLDHISQVYGKDIEFESHGKYGIDLSNARKVKTKGGKDIIYRAGSGTDGRGGTEGGFNFSKSSGAGEALSNLYSLNYHRHYGSLPSDDPSHDRDITYRIVKSGIKQLQDIDDTEAQNTIQRNIFNFITRFINNNKKLSSWNDPKVADLLENSPFPLKEKEEMESGLWLIRHILKNPNAKEEDLSTVDEASFKKIFHDNYDQVENWKTNGKITMRTINWMTQPGVPLKDGEAGWNVVNNTKLKKIFAEYFSNERTKEIIRQQAVHGPKVLSLVITGDPVKDEEIRKKELEKINPEDRERLEKILGPEDWETFQKTGRIPYKIKDEKIKIGVTRTDKDGKTVQDAPKIVLPHVKIGEGENSRYVPLLNTPSFIRSSVDTNSVEASKLKNIITSALKKLKISTDSIDLDSIDDLKKLLNLDNLKDKTRASIEKLMILVGEDSEESLMTTSRSGVILGKDGKETTLNNFYKVPRYSHGLPGTRVTGFRPEVSSQVPGSPHSKEARIGLAKIFQIGTPVMGSQGLIIGKETWDYFKRNPELIPQDVSPMKYREYDLLDTGPDDVPRSGSRYIELGESFKIIKEAEDDIQRDTSGARIGGKLTAKFDKEFGANKHYYDIKPVESGYGNLSGWNDIVMGMTDVFFKKKYGGVDANRIDIRQAVKDFQKIHDEIVDVFYLNAKDKDLYTTMGRRTRAGSEADKFISKANEATGSKARKSRTSTESMIVRNPKSSNEPQANVNNIEPLAYDKSFDKQKRAQVVSIFFDTNNQIVFTSNTGKTWSPTVQMPDSDVKQPYVFRKNKDDLINTLYRNSTILRFLSESSDKIDVSSHKKIIEILDVEKKNLLSFWDTTFPQYTQHYKTTMDKIGGYGEDLLSYIRVCDIDITKYIEDIYEDEKEELDKKATKKIIVPKQEMPVDSQIESGYKDILSLVKEIEGIIEDESYRGKTFFWTTKKDEPIITNWHKAVIGLAKTLVNPASNDNLKKEKLIQVILKHIGGWSTSGGRLKYPAEVFLKRISDNFNQFAKLLKIAPPDGMSEISSTIRNSKNAIASQIPTALTTIKSEFIKQAKAINPEIK